MSQLLRHPKCGKQFPHTSRAGHCSGCCETFIGLSAFDAHRSGVGADRNCINLPDEAGKFWTDEKGYWHTGAKLTEEQKEKMWGNAA